MTTPSKVVLSRQDLYDRLWKTATTKVAKEFGVSDVALGKVCQRYNIPKPPMGYWAKLQHGKKVSRIPLPKNVDPALEEITIYRNQGANDMKPLPPQVSELVEAEKEHDNFIQVAAVLASPNPLVEKTNRSLTSAAVDDKGFVSPKAKRCLSVNIGKDSIDRAMRIMDALLKAFDERKIKYWLEGDDDYTSAYVEISDRKFRFSIDEHIAKKERPLTRDELFDHQRYPTLYPATVGIQEYPSGKLKLHFDGESRWERKVFSEKDGKPLELRLNKIIVWLHTEVERIKERERENAAREKRWAEEARIRAEEERLDRIAAARLEDFQKKAARHRDVQELRDYVKAVEEAGSPLSNPSQRQKLSDWVEWARERIQELV